MKTIKVILKNNNEESIEKYQAICNNKKIIYNEKEFKVTLDYSNSLKMIRENNDYIFELEFISGRKTKGICKLKNEKVDMELDILTDYVIIEDNLIIVKYNVITTEQDVIYRLEII